MTDRWQSLEHHYAKVAGRSLISLFQDENRFQTFSAESDGLLLDYSKTNIDHTARDLLLELLGNSGVSEKRDAMFSGAKINTTETRAVLHTALRSPSQIPLIVDGHDVLPEVRATRARMSAFAEGVRSGAITASDDGRFTDVVNIGIGGSDLGPVMASLALAPYHDGPRTHFVSNVDGAHIFDVLKPLDPARTLVIIASKSFTTTETICNAQTAQNWLVAGNGGGAAMHLAAVSTAEDKTTAFGIAPDRVFGFEDWVGGRYSLWGPVGLPIMLAVGPTSFAQFLAGGAAMDSHFCTAPMAQNLPVLLAAVGIWHNNICGYPTRAVLPYDQRLSRLPAYLQQLDMESNGKGVTLDGKAVERKTGAIVWGEPGTNGQHAFYQLIHQGTSIVPCEFLIAATGHEPHLAHQHDLLKANCLAQSRALMTGRSLAQARKIVADMGLPKADTETQARHRVFPGNRPSITLVYHKLTPFVLGQLIALYEHRVFVEGVVWGINSFDQWGVELGKELANMLVPIVKGGPTTGLDGSTQGLLGRLTT